MNRLGLSHARNDAMPRRDIATPAAAAPREARQPIPKADETIGEIGIIVALHLAFAFAVLLTLRAYGVS